MSEIIMRYEHDCAVCEPLGQFCDFDLYYCDKGGIRTLIARYGPGSEYRSGFQVGTKGYDPVLSIAYQMAVLKGCIPEDDATRIYWGATDPGDVSNIQWRGVETMSEKEEDKIITELSTDPGQTISTDMTEDTTWRPETQSIPDQEVWLRAWCACASAGPSSSAYKHGIAEECLDAFKARFGGKE